MAAKKTATRRRRGEATRRAAPVAGRQSTAGHAELRRKLEGYRARLEQQRSLPFVEEALRQLEFAHEALDAGELGEALFRSLDVAHAAGTAMLISYAGGWRSMANGKRMRLTKSRQARGGAARGRKKLEERKPLLDAIGELLDKNPKLKPRRIGQLLATKFEKSPRTIERHARAFMAPRGPR